jgi:hypothetical protein
MAAVPGSLGTLPCAMTTVTTDEYRRKRVTIQFSSGVMTLRAPYITVDGGLAIDVNDQINDPYNPIWTIINNGSFVIEHFRLQCSEEFMIGKDDFDILKKLKDIDGVEDIHVEMTQDEITTLCLRCSHKLWTMDDLSLGG